MLNISSMSQESGFSIVCFIRIHLTNSLCAKFPDVFF